MNAHKGDSPWAYLVGLVLCKALDDVTCTIIALHMDSDALPFCFHGELNVRDGEVVPTHTHTSLYE